MQTRYRNTDFDLISNTTLDTLVKYFEKSSMIPISNFHDNQGNHHVTFEIIDEDNQTLHDSAETTINAMLSVIEQLPPQETAILNQCDVREFNTAYDLGTEPHDFNEGISQETLKNMSQFHTSFRITLYRG